MAMLNNQMVILLWMLSNGLILHVEVMALDLIFSSCRNLERTTSDLGSQIPALHKRQAFHQFDTLNDSTRIGSQHFTTTLGGAHSLLILAASGGSLFMADRALFGGSWLVHGMQVQCSSVLATKTMPFHDISLENPYLGLKIGSPRFDTSSFPVWSLVLSHLLKYWLINLYRF